MSTINRHRDVHTSLRSWIDAAILAPSSHNTQPWRFRVSADGIDVIADRSRALPVNDPGDRELTISCGCALMNLRIAAAADGVSTCVSVPPRDSDPDLLARLTVSADAADLALAALRDAIDRRHTHRQAFATQPVSAETLNALAEAARAEGASLHALTSATQRDAAAALVAQGDAAQWANAPWRHELAAWMHPRAQGDGLSLPAPVAPVARLVVRTLDMSKRVAAGDRALAAASPVLALLSTADDDAPAWLAAGQALQRMLLVAVRHGLQASFLNQPVEVQSLRRDVQAVTGRPGHAQLLVRLGKPTAAVKAAPRRPVSDVIVEALP